tara:strand:- start:13351 stop:13662 length:312 start_codon:yes stop_codon:yes gene_type:complete
MVEKKIHHISYSVSTNDLVDIWAESIHPDEHILVLHDAKKHFVFLKSLGLAIKAENLYDNKILILQLESLEDALILMKIIPPESGPYVQVYSLGQFITDNIEK